MAGEDLLEKLYARLLGVGSPVALEAAASDLLATRSIPLASRVLERLLSDDGRFRVAGGLVSAIPPRDPFEGKKLHEIGFAVLDFETNGLAPGERAIEVGLVVWNGGREADAYETRLDPGTPLSPFVQRLTGIRPEELSGKPAFGAVWPEVARRLEGRVLVAHNLPFDRRILRREVSLLGRDLHVGRTGLCTVRLSRRLFPAEESHALDAAAGRFGLEFSARHRALDDARVTARLLQRLLDEAASRYGVATWDDLGRLLTQVPARRSPRACRRRRTAP